MQNPRYDQHLNGIVKQANDAVAGTDDCQHHFYAGGDARLLNEVLLGDGSTTLQPGVYRIMNILPSPVTMFVLPVAATEPGAIADLPAQSGEASWIRIVGADCNLFAADRIPFDIRSASDDQDAVAPFHLRDAETDEEPEELAETEDAPRNHFTDFASAVSAAREWALMTGREISICNGYSNSVETVAPEDVDPAEATRDKNKVYLRSRSSAPYNAAEEDLSREDRLIRHNAHLAEKCPDCKHERHDGVVCYVSMGQSPFARICNCTHGVTGDALTELLTPPVFEVGMLLVSPPCEMHATSRMKFKVLEAEAAHDQKSVACVLYYDQVKARRYQTGLENLLRGASVFDTVEGVLPLYMSATLTSNSPDQLPAAEDFDADTFKRLVGIYPVEVRLRCVKSARDKNAGEFCVVIKSGDTTFITEYFDFK